MVMRALMAALAGLLAVLAGCGDYARHGGWSPRPAPGPYRVTDLGVLPGYSQSVAGALNNHRQVVGTCTTPSRDRHAFIWDAAGGMRPLEAFVEGADNGANDINDAGQVVGWSQIAAPGVVHAALWDSVSGPQDLGAGPSAGWSEAQSANSLGQVAGSVSGPAFHWDSSSGMQLLPVLDGASYAYATAINDLGQVVGSGFTGAFLWDSAGGTRGLDGLPDNDWSSATDITNAGRIVGRMSVGGVVRPFAWDDAEGVTDLGLLPGFPASAAWSINEHGWVVGYGEDPDRTHAFLWTPENGMQDLNDLLTRDSRGWVLTDARDINEAGDIAGKGLNPNGELHAFLATPVR
jgi:probable HAF family extracellular repeat protein